MIPILKGTDPEKLVPHMELVWLNPAFKTNKRMVHWSGVTLEPHEGTWSGFLDAVIKKNHPGDMALWVDKSSNLVVIAWVDFAEPEII